MAGSSPEAEASSGATAPAAVAQPSGVIVDVVVTEPKSFGDDRGRFTETYRRSWFPGGREMIQANRSEKGAGSLVGMHYHLHQADYWFVTRGRARVVLHDLREGSPTAGVTMGLDLTPDGDGDRGVYIPPGVGHGFAALTDVTLVYLVDRYYDPDDELGVAWDDAGLDADWGLDDPVISKRDQNNPGLDDLPPGARPLYGPPVDPPLPE